MECDDLYGLESFNDEFNENEFPTEADFEQEVNDILTMYDNATFSEPYYIHNVQYECSPSTSLKCGLSPARNFEPAIKLENSDINISISFNSSEWQSLINHIDWMNRAFFNNTAVEPKLTLFGNIELIGISDPSSTIKLLQLRKTDAINFYLTSEEVSKILELDYLISFNIEMLNTLNFPQYYLSVLDIVNEIIKTYEDVNPLMILESFCNLSYNTIQSYCFKECLHFNRNKVLNDLDMRNYQIS